MSAAVARSSTRAVAAAAQHGTRLATRAASSSASPSMDWTKQSWATLSHIPERIQIEGADPNARVNEDHSNIEFVFPLMSRKAKDDYYRQMSEVSKKDWTQLSMNERKALYYIAFGPYGPRKPLLPPGSSIRLWTWSIGIFGAAGAVFAYYHFRHTMPRTMTKEWQEAANERAQVAHQEPFRGLGKKGHVQSSH